MANSTSEDERTSRTTDDDQYYANRLLLITFLWLVLVLGAGVLMIFLI